MAQIEHYKKVLIELRDSYPEILEEGNIRQVLAQLIRLSERYELDTSLLLYIEALVMAGVDIPELIECPISRQKFDHSPVWKDYPSQIPAVNNIFAVETQEGKRIYLHTEISKDISISKDVWGEGIYPEFRDLVQETDHGGPLVAFTDSKDAAAWCEYLNEHIDKPIDEELNVQRAGWAFEFGVMALLEIGEYQGHKIYICI